MVPAALLAASLGFQAFGSFRASRARAKQARYNAWIAKMAADQALQRGEERAGMVELASSVRQGAQVAAYGHAGVDVTSGSPVKTVSTTALVGALDAQIQRNNAYREAWGYRTQSALLGSEAKREDQAAFFDLFGSVFGGASKVATVGS